MAMLFDHPFMDDLFEDISFGQSRSFWDDDSGKLNLGLLNLPTPPLSPEQDVKPKIEELTGTDYEVDWYMSANPSNFILNDRILCDDRLFADLDIKPFTPDPPATQLIRPITPPSPKRRRYDSPLIRVDGDSPVKKFTLGSWPVTTATTVKEERMSPPPMLMEMDPPHQPICTQQPSSQSDQQHVLDHVVKEEILDISTILDDVIGKGSPSTHEDEEDESLVVVKDEVVKKEVKEEPSADDILTSLAMNTFQPKQSSSSSSYPSSVHLHPESEECNEGCVKRQAHVFLERKRRNDLNKHYASLKEEVPTISESDKVSKVLILKRAAEYITTVQEEEVALKEELRAERSRQRNLINKFKLLYKITHKKQKTGDVTITNVD